MRFCWSFFEAWQLSGNVGGQDRWSRAGARHRAIRRGRVSLKLLLTWPEELVIPVDVLPCCERALTHANEQVCSGMLQTVDGDLRVQRMFDCDKRVPDADSFRIRHTGASMLLTEREDVPLSVHLAPYTKSCGVPSVRPYCSTLAVVLESPHKDEFGPSLSPLFPAQGKTGDNLKDWLIDVIGADPELKQAIIGRVPVRVVLCNPIQFQTSLHAIHGVGRRSLLPKGCGHGLTRAVWRAVWSVGGVRDDFLERLRAIDADWILNACVLDGYLNWTISSFLGNSNLRARKFRTVHPSRWRRTWPAWCEPL